MTTLHRAVALSESDDRAVRVGKELHLDVPRPLEVALAVEGPVTERGHGLALGSGEGVVQLAGIANHAHPAPPPPAEALTTRGKPISAARPFRKRGHARFTCDPLRRELVPAQPQRLCGRPDPGQPCRVDGLRERRALGEKSVAGMDRVRSGRLRGTDVLLRIEIAGDLDDLVCRASMQRAGVVGGSDGHRGDAQLVAGAEDANRDLAPVCDEQLLDRHEAELRD